MISCQEQHRHHALPVEGKCHSKQPETAQFSKLPQLMAPDGEAALKNRNGDDAIVLEP
jgi:hypothetical protein